MSRARTIAERATGAGGAALRVHAGRISGLRTKSSGADLVSEADVAAGVAVARLIAEADPTARFVIEEGEVYERAGVIAGGLDDAAVWVVDPLDGTTSFVHGYPCWSVSVAYLEHGQPVAGAVLDVPSGVLYSAALGGGATANGRPLVCAGERSIDEALLITGFPYDRTVALGRQLALLRAVLLRVHDVRRDGSAAVDLCRIAAGQADGFWEIGLRPWDMAAGVLVVREAGGTVTGLDGSPWTTTTTDVVAAYPALHAGLLDVLDVADREWRGPQ